MVNGTSGIAITADERDQIVVGVRMVVLGVTDHDQEDTRDL